MFYFLFVLLNLLAAANVEVVETVIGEEFIIELPENLSSSYRWKLDERYTFVGYVSYVADYVDRSRPEFHVFVFQAVRVGYTTLSFSLGSLETKEYQVHIIEKPDTLMIDPILSDIGMIHPVHKPVEVVVGSEVMIDIIENPTTGYTWKLFDESYASGGFLSYVSDSMMLIEDGEQSDGAPSIHRFVFRGLKSGMAKVRFVQARFGEVDASAVPESYFVHVVEKPDTGMISPAMPDIGRIDPVHKPLQVVVGSEVVIDMMENPTTGYRWKLLDESYASGGFLSYVSDFEVEMDGGEGSKMGAPSIHRFVFSGMKSGMAKVRFVQARFGEIDTSAVPESYFVHVVEKPDTGMISPK